MSIISNFHFLQIAIKTFNINLITVNTYFPFEHFIVLTQYIIQGTNNFPIISKELIKELLISNKYKIIPQKCVESEIE